VISLLYFDTRPNQLWLLTEALLIYVADVSAAVASKLIRPDSVLTLPPPIPPVPPP